MTRSILGLDIGGANLKAAVVGSATICRSQPFALWREPGGLAPALAELLATLPPADEFAITMTGELCDCFSSKREGILHILDATERIAQGRTVHVWCCDGAFRDLLAARSAPPLLVAASNWLALATWAGRLVPTGPALLLDVGSTTTDVIPLLDGKPIPTGRTDFERLRTSELVYTGVRRTPVCVLFPRDAAAEWFATTLDVYLVLGDIPEDSADRDTADGRPATLECASARLARVFCGDLETTSEHELFVLAGEARRRQLRHLSRAIQRVMRSLPSPPAAVVLSGSGEFLARAAVQERMWQTVSVAQQCGEAVSASSCAYAVAVLASEGAAP